MAIFYSYVIYKLPEGIGPRYDEVWEILERNGAFTARDGPKHGDLPAMLLHDLIIVHLYAPHWLSGWKGWSIFQQVLAYMEKIYPHIPEMQQWSYIPASSNVCKMIAFSGIIAAGFLLLPQQFLYLCILLSCCMCLPVLTRRKKTRKHQKNLAKRH